MFKGTLNITTDINTVQNMMGTHRVVVIGEPDPQLIQMSGAIVGSVLLPPYPAMMALMDNDINTFNNFYNNHLCSNECVSFITVLVKAMINGTSLLMYMTQDEYNMYFNALKVFIRVNYGIEIGSINNPFTYDNSFDCHIYSLLYLNDLITIQEFFIVYPQGVQFNDNIVMKLINEMRPGLMDTSFESYRNYFYNYKESVKQTNTFIPNIFSRKL